MGDGLFDVDVPVSEDKLTLVSNHCKELRDKERELNQLEDEVKRVKADIEDLSRVKIPTIFNELGLSQLRLMSGEIVEVVDQLKPSIADKNYVMAFRNMVDAEANDSGDAELAEAKIDALFKSEIVVADYSEEVVEKLLDADIPFDTKRSIHWQTLRKYCQERLDNGKSIPEGISVFQYQETKIK